jgi:hypothetical protein
MAFIRHTFLFEEARWAARGTFFDAGGAATAVDGAARITHADGAWFNRSFMRRLADSPLEVTNDCRIVPFAPGALATRWESTNVALGRLAGRFALVGDSILSTYATEAGDCSGSECLQMTAEDRYLGRGVLYRDGALFSSWIVELRREG